MVLGRSGSLYWENLDPCIRKIWILALENYPNSALHSRVPGGWFYVPMRSAAGLLPKRPRILTPRVADKKRYKRHVAFATLRPNGRPRPQTPFFTLVLSTFLLHLPPLVARGRPWSPMPPQMPPDASQVPPRCLQMYKTLFGFAR